MDLVVRPALPTDPCVPLLFESAQPYYTAYAGSERRALALLEAVFTVPGHAASFECCTVAMDGETLVGVVAGFPVRRGRSAARGGSSALTLPQLPPWRWPATFAAPARRRATSRPRRRRTPTTSTRWPSRTAGGAAAIARRLLDEARIEAERSGLHRLALDTGLHNDSARRAV